MRDVVAFAHKDMWKLALNKRFTFYCCFYDFCNVGHKIVCMYIYICCVCMCVTLCMC